MISALFGHGFREVPHLHSVGTQGKLAAGTTATGAILLLGLTSGLTLAVSPVRLHMLISRVLRFFLLYNLFIENANIGYLKCKVSNRFELKLNFPQSHNC